VGAIGERARAYLPFSWDGLSKAPQYGPSLLQGRVERAKYEVLGASAPIEAAESSLPEDQLEHIAKRSVLKVIPAAIEFWANQPISKSTTGTAEVVAYESRIEYLKTLFAQLTQEVATEEPTVTPIVQLTGIPGVSDGQNDILVTANPHDFPRPYTIGTEEV
jgi:hypothetical protein